MLVVELVRGFMYPYEPPEEQIMMEEALKYNQEK